MNNQKVIRFCKRLSLVFFVAGLLLSSMDAGAQSNRGKHKNNFSKSGKSFAVMRHGMTLNLGTSLDITPMVGLGYACSQYYGIGNRFMQQSLTYQVGIGDELIHNVVGAFHCSYIGNWDMNPFLYGLAVHFAMSPDKYSETNMGNLYLRPEFGISFPMKYGKRTQERLPFSASIMYGYNLGLFMNRSELQEYRERYGINSDADLPWTSVNHHMITIRLNFNFANIREFQ